ncbi:hypothetical protein AALP_AA4G136500 [Arabis alpina]|uniref:Large ribosomal subunit protein bL12 C-terminal domain-containing protein n=1 Tax=Arabis alpina TaxID=50452 RepID=A0A087H333_ARAAL|nr:hypothetical protein AALP_AA4G136500 [Arabis alpina]
MASTSLAITNSIFSSSHSSANHHFLSRSGPFAIEFPFRFLASSSSLSHRAIYLPSISAVKTPKKIKKIGAEITSLTLEEARVLVDYVHDKFGASMVFSATATTTAIAPLAESGGVVAAGVENQTKFNVVINQVPSSMRISVIKAIRALSSLPLSEGKETMPLMEAKELIEGLPKTFKEGMTQDEAEEAKKQLEEVGAEVSIV